MLEAYQSRSNYLVFDTSGVSLQVLMGVNESLSTLKEGFVFGHMTCSEIVERELSLSSLKPGSYDQKAVADVAS